VSSQVIHIDAVDIVVNYPLHIRQTISSGDAVQFDNGSIVSEWYEVVKLVNKNGYELEDPYSSVHVVKEDDQVCIYRKQVKEGIHPKVEMVRLKCVPSNEPRVIMLNPRTSEL